MGGPRPDSSEFELGREVQPEVRGLPLIADVGQNVPYRDLGSGDVAEIQRQGYTTVDGVELPRLQLLFGSDQTWIGFRRRWPEVTEGTRVPMEAAAGNKLQPGPLLSRGPPP